jgi:hypothetical protein
MTGTPSACPAPVLKEYARYPGHRCRFPSRIETTVVRLTGRPSIPGAVTRPLHAELDSSIRAQA